VNGVLTVNLDWLPNSESDLAVYVVWRSETSGSGYDAIAGTVDPFASEVSGTPTGGTTNALQYPENLTATAIGEWVGSPAN